MFYKKLFLKISQYSQENPSVGDSFFKKVAGLQRLRTSVFGRLNNRYLVIYIYIYISLNVYYCNLSLSLSLCLCIYVCVYIYIYIKNVKFSGYYFCMNKQILEDFQICISVPLKYRCLSVIVRESLI